MERADEFAGRDILAPEKQLKTPEEGGFYDFALIGCSVVTAAGLAVGVVRDVEAIGASTLLVVDGVAGAKEILIPFSRNICLEVDLQGKRIVIDPPDGLLDLNEI